MKGVYVVGTGRSGTHFSVRLMSGFKNARDPLKGRENPVVLQDVALAALHHRLPSKSTERYYRDALSDGEGVFLDQHHPNLFFVKHWSDILGDIVFLYPQRPTYQVVASMLRHRGVMGWYKYARGLRQRTINRIPYPNQFLGVEKSADIGKLPSHLLCAHRVIAHRMAFDSTQRNANGALRQLNYEALVDNPINEFSRVFSTDEMAQLGPFTLTEEPKKTSLMKYRDVLSDEQVAEIVALEERSCLMS